MKCVYLDALSYEGDYSYNTVPMFTWITVEGTLVAVAASIPLLRPLVKHHLGSTNRSNSYDLPRYYGAGRSGHTDSSGFSRLPKLRTSVNMGKGVASVSSPRSAASYGVGGLDGDDSDEGVLVLQHPQQELKHEGGQGRLQAQQKGLPDIPAQRRKGSIMVRQDFTVTSEEKGEGWDESVRGSGGLRMHGSEQSLEGAGLPRVPPTAWSQSR